jgi:type I restriction enzyme S subunit
MQFARLENVCEINPRIPKTLADDDLAAFLPMAAVSETGQVDFEEQRRVREVKTGYTYFARGDILLAKITPCFENGKAARTSAIAHPIGFGSTEFHVLRAGSEIDPSYLFHLAWNSKFRAIGAKNMTGSAGQKRLPAEFLKRLEIPLPPLDEQRRIAAILDKADALRRKRKLTDELLHSARNALVARLLSISQGKTEQLGNSLTFITTGGRNWSQYYRDGGDRFIRSLDVQMNAISAEDPVYVAAPDDAEARRTRTVEGDVLLTVTGSRIGRVAELPANLARSYVSQHVAILRPDQSKTRSKFLAYFLSSENGQHQIRKWQYGQTKPGLNFQQIQGFEIPSISNEQQIEFEEKIKLVEIISARQQLHDNKLNQLFSSLQHRAFSGQL